MTAARRWCIVAVGIAVLMALPAAIRALPARDSALSAAELLRRVKASGGVAYSGYAEAVGGLQLPVTDEFSDLANLLGERTKLRVWWRGDDNWRVDALEPGGETDLIHDARGTTVWEYEAARVTRTTDPEVRLPRTADLLPSLLGRRLLSEARTDEVSRLPAERVAGRDAPGLRLDPADPQSSVDHVDVWVDSRTGLPLRVAVFGPAEDTAAMTTSFSSCPPRRRQLRPRPSPGRRVLSSTSRTPWTSQRRPTSSLPCSHRIVWPDSSDGPGSGAARSATTDVA